jgi:hypothetical protein
MADLDIVLRLGLLAKTLRAGSWFDSETIAQDALDAADEIERLRYENEAMRTALQAISESSGTSAETLLIISKNVLALLERQRPT